MTYKTKTRIKGFATVSVALALSVGVAIIGGVATFFKVTGEVDKRITTVETQIPFILKSQETMAEDIGEIKSILMQK